MEDFKRLLSIIVMSAFILFFTVFIPITYHIKISEPLSTNEQIREGQGMSIFEADIYDIVNKNETSIGVEKLLTDFDQYMDQKTKEYHYFWFYTAVLLGVVLIILGLIFLKTQYKCLSCSLVIAGVVSIVVYFIIHSCILNII